jgi:hypothetical protein
VKPRLYTAGATPRNQVLTNAHLAALPLQAASPTATPGRALPATQRELTAPVFIQHAEWHPERLEWFGSAHGRLACAFVESTGGLACA